ncbi:MAG: homogentisate 1,2-dioxygenase [Carbonactinosporaceae bacterium]
MPHYRAVGDIPRKRHTQFRKPDGTLYAEELMGVEGFSSDSALLYHAYLPTAIVDAQVWDAPATGTTSNLPLRPRHLRTEKLDAAGCDAVIGRAVLLANDDVRISYVAADRPSELYRNAVGDECVYVRSGRARLETIFGVLELGEGDYVVIPTSTVHRWVPLEGVPLRLLTVEASGHIAAPRRYLSARGQFLEHAPYCERDLRGPAGPHVVEGEDVDVLVRHRVHGGGPGSLVGTRFTYARHPFDVVGWDGCLYPYAFNIADFEPITGRVHQPPPVHQTFEGPGFVVCSFRPRKLDYHPEAVPLPYNHANVDSDEMLFYVGGSYEARSGSGIGLGSISLHPSGFTHGPQPGAVERALGKESTDETAVMIDTFRPLGFGDAALACEDTSYAWSWSGGQRS